MAVRLCPRGTALTTTWHRSRSKSLVNIYLLCPTSGNDRTVATRRSRGLFPSAGKAVVSFRLRRPWSCRTALQFSGGSLPVESSCSTPVLFCRDTYHPCHPCSPLNRLLKIVPDFVTTPCSQRSPRLAIESVATHLC